MHTIIYNIGYSNTFSDLREYRNISWLILDVCVWVIPCQINQFFAKFASHPSDFDEIWYTCR